MANSINQNDDLSNVLSAKPFLNFSDDVKKETISAILEQKKTNGGLLGKLFGVNTENAAVNIGFLICCFLIILIAADFVRSWIMKSSTNDSLINFIIPVITSCLGYIFGQGRK